MQFYDLKLYPDAHDEMSKIFPYHVCKKLIFLFSLAHFAFLSRHTLICCISVRDLVGVVLLLHILHCTTALLEEIGYHESLFIFVGGGLFGIGRFGKLLDNLF